MLIKMLEELKEGQTHYFNDNCGEKNHNKDTRILEHNQTVAENRRVEKWGRVEKWVMNIGIVVGIAFVGYLLLGCLNQ